VVVQAPAKAGKGKSGNITPKPKSKNYLRIPKNGMEKKMTQIKKFFKDEPGVSAVDFGLLVASIACAIVAAFNLLGASLYA
jgi:Flp pilus assembly pilin Flp